MLHDLGQLLVRCSHMLFESRVALRDRVQVGVALEGPMLDNWLPRQGPRPTRPVNQPDGDRADRPSSEEVACRLPP
eukprot:7098795-Pyramimonas_sp.AAC.1